MGILGLINARKRTVRAPLNPVDKSTIVSIYPKNIVERKYTIEPGIFKIAAGSFSKPSILVVGSSSWWREIDEEQPLLEIPNSSIQIADSVVKDFCNGLLGCNMGSSMPGLFWIPSELTVEDVIKNHMGAMLTAKAKQDTFYNALIKLADTMWARTNGNPLVIADDMRIAAKEMNVHAGKPWMKDFTITTEMSKCPACGYLMNTDYPICGNCKTIVNVEKYKALTMQSVDVPAPSF